MISMTDPSTFLRLVRRSAVLALGLVGGATSVSLSAQTAEPLDFATQVVVSRNEVRVYFAPETPNTWDSPVAAGGGNGPARFRWVAMLEGNGPGSLGLSFSADPSRRVAPSLDSIARTGRLQYCRMTNMGGGPCSSADIAATVEDQRIVLIYRDTLEIRQLFGLRPASVFLFRMIPSSSPDDHHFANAPVRYIDPPILLDSAQRLAVVRERRRREASINSYSRSIVGGSDARTLWLVVGDSAELAVEDFHCHVDLCSSYDYPFARPHDWGRWSLSDSSIARLRPLTAAEALRPGDYNMDGAMRIVAVRPGRLKVRATGVHTSVDTMPSYNPLDTILEREVVVTRPASRLVISPRPTSMIAGTPLTFSVRLLDHLGRTIDGPVIQLKWDTYVGFVRMATDTVGVTFTQPGRHWVTASLRMHTDSVSVDVLPANRAP